jgi:hypothetical protein
VNDISESLPASLVLLSASVPQKPQAPILVTSTENSIEVSSNVSFDGGDSISHFVFTRDDGPLTQFTEEAVVSQNSYKFTGLN